MALYFLALLAVSLRCYANFAESFAASTSTAGLGQTNQLTGDAANNYYHPSVLAWNQDLDFSLSTFYIYHDFKDINNVRIRNTQNSNETTDGEINTNYEDLAYGAIHVSLPIKGPKGNKLGLSVFTPLNRLLEANSGDPFLTEYVMYKARYKRTVAYLNWIIPYKENQGLSFGFYTGIQASANVYTRTSIDQNFNSYGRVKTKARPSLAGYLSYTYKESDHIYSLTYQQEMESKFVANTTGANDNPNITFDISLNSLMYYDPHTIRASYSLNKSSYSLHGTIEYQFWEAYKTPVIEITSNPGSSLSPSTNFENVPTKDTIVPKLGLSYKTTDSITLRSGISYRPSPFDSSFSGPGNSVDTDSATLSLGLSWLSKLMGVPLSYDIGLQYMHLVDKTISKTAGTMENGAAGEKIGSPGYDIGGQIINSSFGIQMEL